jgi:hypothetical protein
MASYTLKNDLSTVPLNCNFGYNNSWINVENNADRQLFAQASYITNFDDINISLSSSNVNIGIIKIQDSDTGLLVDVVPVGVGMGALRVLTQDLESYQDDITIGDKNGNFANVYSALSALQVYDVNPVKNVGVSNAIDWNTIPVIATINYYTPLSSIDCSLVTIYNSSTGTINIKRTGSSFAIPLKKNCSIDINVVKSSDEISVSSETYELTASALITKF